MSDTRLDVNTSAPAPSTESSTAQQVQVSQADSSAETLKTDTSEHEKYVPYERFKEVNEKLQGYSAKAELLSQYEQLDEYLRNNPEAYNRVKSALAEQQQAQGQVQNQPQQLDPIAALTNEVTELKRDRAVESYEMAFQQITNDIPANQRDTIAPLVAAEMKRLTGVQNVLDIGFRPDVLNTAYQNVRNVLDSYASAKQTSYSQQKQADSSIPTIKGGGAPIQQTPKRFGSADEKLKFAMETLKSSKTM